jgi:hypothetical protein
MITKYYITIHHNNAKMTYKVSITWESDPLRAHTLGPRSIYQTLPPRPRRMQNWNDDEYYEI